jgi:hypothetical protein
MSAQRQEEEAMGMWRPKQEESKSLWFRVPVSLKQEFEALRQQAEAAGLDASATFTAALGRLAKQLREELGSTAARADGAVRPGKANGLDKHASAGGQRTSAAS